MPLFLGINGRIGRPQFWLGLTGLIVAFWLGIWASSSALPWMASVLAPRGVNAGFALNLIWSLLGLMLVWSACALTAKRLRDRGLSSWWGAAAVLPLAALAVVDDAIFLVSRSVSLPPAAQAVVGGIAGAIGMWVLWECAHPSRSPST